VRGHELAAASGARLVVCHVGPPRLRPICSSHRKSARHRRSHPTGRRDGGSRRSVRVVDLTGRSRRPSTSSSTGERFSCAVRQSTRSPGPHRGHGDTRLTRGPASRHRDLVRGCVCSVLVLSGGDRVSAKSAEADGVAVSPSRARSSSFPNWSRRPFRVLDAPVEIDVVLWVSERDVQASAITRSSPDKRATSASARAVVCRREGYDAAHGTGVSSPVDRPLGFRRAGPCELAKSASSPIDDVLPEAASSILLLRLGWPMI